MPIVTVTPNNKTAEDYLEGGAGEILLEALRKIVLEVWDVPDEDVLVRGYRCPTLLEDVKSADVDIWVETNPNPKLEAKADALRDALARGFRAMTSVFSAEIWIRFTPGSWCGIARGGDVFDHVDHPGLAVEPL